MGGLEILGYTMFTNRMSTCGIRYLFIEAGAHLGPAACVALAALTFWLLLGFLMFSLGPNLLSEALYKSWRPSFSHFRGISNNAVYLYIIFHSLQNSFTHI